MPSGLWFSRGNADFLAKNMIEQRRFPYIRSTNYCNIAASCFVCHTFAFLCLNLVGVHGRLPGVFWRTEIKVNGLAVNTILLCIVGCL